MELNIRHLSNPLTRRFRHHHFDGDAGTGDLARAVERLFDEFFELEWIFDHRHGAASHVLASAAAALLAREGWPARVACCQCEIRKGGRMLHLGAKAWAVRDQSTGHAVCIISENLLLDFALSDVRRNFDRGFPWGIASPVRRDRDLIASLDVAGHGRVRWHGEAPAMDAPQAMKVAALLPRLLEEHKLAFG